MEAMLSNVALVTDLASEVAGDGLISFEAKSVDTRFLANDFHLIT